MAPRRRNPVRCPVCGRFMAAAGCRFCAARQASLPTTAQPTQASSQQPVQQVVASPPSSQTRETSAIRCPVCSRFMGADGCRFCRARQALLPGTVQSTQAPPQQPVQPVVASSASSPIQAISPLVSPVSAGERVDVAVPETLFSGSHTQTSVQSELSRSESSSFCEVPEPVENCCAACLCIVPLCYTPRDNVRARMYSQIELRREARDLLPLCHCCFNYVAIDTNRNPQPQNSQNLQNPEHLGTTSDDSLDVSDSSSSLSEDEHPQAANKNAVWKYGWRAFLTYFVLHSSNVADFEKRVSYVPLTFSTTWGRTFENRALPSVHMTREQCRNTIDGTPCLVRDITTKLEAFEADINTGRLSHLAKAMNQTAVPSVRCPYGCSEFLEKTGSVAYNHFLRSRFPAIKAFGANAERYLKGCRRDFTERTKYFGVILMPCVRVTAEGLVLCTCRSHDKGSSLSYVHPPHNPHGTLPSAFSDRFTPAIFSPKPFRGMKAKYSSHTWQMRSVQGGFSGLSSFSLTNTPKWDIMSDLHTNLESLYLANRPDLKAFVNSKYSNDPLSTIPLRSLSDHPQPSVEATDKALDGATYVTLQESLSLLHSMKHSVAAVVREPGLDEEDQAANLQAEGNGLQDGNHVQLLAAGQPVGEQVNDQPNTRKVAWPLSFALSHTVDEYGAMPCLINSFHGKFFPLLWAFTRLVSFLPPLWECLAAAEPTDQGDEAQVASLQNIKFFCSKSLPLGGHTRTTVNERNRRQKPRVIQQLLRERASTINDLIPNRDEDEQCLHTCVILARVLKTLPDTCVKYIDRRSHPINSEMISQMLEELPNDEAVHNCKAICICTDARPSTARHSVSPPSVITCADSTWELVSMLRADGSSESPWNDPEGGTAVIRRWDATCFLHSEGKHGWFKSQRSPIIARVPADDAELQNFHKSWGCLIYTRTSGGYRLDAKLRYLQYTGGQGCIVCKEHCVPLTIAPIIRNSDYKRGPCSFQDGHSNYSCNRIGKWSCPTQGCSSAVCNIHGKYLLDRAATTQRIFSINPRPQTDGQPILPDVPLWDEDDEQQNDDPLRDLIELQDDDSDADLQVGNDLLMDTDFDILEDGVLDEDEDQGLVMPATNAADIPVMQDGPSGVPGHILLNKHLALLTRPGITNFVGSKQAAFFQRVTARFAGASIPLLYPEGMLFPSIFWKSMSDGTVVGALPHCLWTSASACRKAGFADLTSHIKTRLLDPTLLTSTDPRAIQFYFDALFNLQLSRSDTRIILSRGWEHLSSDPSTYQTLQTEGRLPFGEADSRKRVNELAAEIAREQPTYFYTHSCNQSEHFGVKPIFDWIQKHYEFSSKEVRDSAVQASLIPILRAWERAGTYLMDYIQNSHEQPLGPVKKLWWRWEFQTTRGNLPHIHALVWTGEDPESDAVRHRLTSTLKQCFFDKAAFKEAGLVETDEDIWKLKNLASKVQEHSCEKAGYRCCKKRDSDGKSVCRFPQRPASETYCTRKIYVEHSEAALAVLQECGLAEEGVRPNGRRGLVLTPDLEARKHMYPAVRDERFSPFSDWIFAAAKSSDNLQICSPTFTARYLAKYAAGEEERARVFLKCGRSENLLAAVEDPLRNLKVTGAAIAAETDKKKERTTSAVEGRTLALTEAVFWTLGFKYVHLSCASTHSPWPSRKWEELHYCSLGCVCLS